MLQTQHKFRTPGPGSKFQTNKQPSRVKTARAIFVREQKQEAGIPVWLLPSEYRSRLGFPRAVQTCYFLERPCFQQLSSQTGLLSSQTVLTNSWPCALRRVHQHSHMRRESRLRRQETRSRRQRRARTRGSLGRQWRSLPDHLGSGRRQTNAGEAKYGTPRLAFLV